MDKATTILQSWQANADNWIATIDGNEIESRNLVTNAAIVDAVIQYKPGKVLDIGCGEGWLTRKLQLEGIPTHGIDAIDTLVENAKAKGGNHYSVCSYEDLINNQFTMLKEVDGVVINFALLDKDVTDKLIIYLGSTLRKGSLVFIQTLHPLTIALTRDYKTGWMEGSWDGLARQFTHAYQWYFRTFADWINLFSKSGLRLLEMKEPVHPLTNKPASVIFILQV